MTIADSPPLDIATPDAIAGKAAGRTVAAGTGADASPGAPAVAPAPAPAAAPDASPTGVDASSTGVTEARALERVLAALEWRVTETRAIEPSLDGPTRHGGEHPVMLYVTSGSVRVRYRVGGAELGSARPGQVGSGDPGRPDGGVRGHNNDGSRALCSRELSAGDLALSVAGRPFGLVADDAATRVIVSDLAFAGSAPFALGALPSMLVVRDFATHEPAIAALAASMGPRCEVHRSRVADSVVCSHIATTVVAVAVRAWNELGCAPGDWLLRTDDPRLARVLDAIHGDPGHAWTVGELAAVGTMSRSVFAERFRELVGQSPASYLADVRMARAKALFLREGLSVAAVAHQLGYESEAGFSRAFRRQTGLSPAAWRQRELAGAGAPAPVLAEAG